MPLSKTQIDRLGDRLKKGSHTESDLRLLDEYRRSFGEAYEFVIQKIRQCGEFPTGRLAKSTLSIVEKLRRESIRLSQMQDIAGCRVVVQNVVDQDKFVASIKTDFPEAAFVDRRENPSHGYRAVHIIVEEFGKPIEIQVRSSLQHLWAELSEKSADVLDPTIKYGGGSDWWRNFLTKISEALASYEKSEMRYSNKVTAHEVREKAVADLSKHDRPMHDAQEMRGELKDSTHFLEEYRALLVDLRKAIADPLTEMIARADKLKEQKQ